MSFPKVPKKKVSGALKLVVRPPTTAEIGDTAEEQDELLEPEDHSSEITVRLPRWLSLSTTPQELVAQQREAALSRLDELAVSSSCCKKAEEHVIRTARRLVEDIAASMSSFAKGRMSIVVGQRPGGEITLDFTAGPRLLAAVVSSASVGVGFYQNNVLKGEDRIRITGPVPTKDLCSWLVGDK